jgi:hypothetical protein
VSLFHPVFTVVIYHIFKEISTFFPLFWEIEELGIADFEI